MLLKSGKCEQEIYGLVSEDVSIKLSSSRSVQPVLENASGLSWWEYLSFPLLYLESLTAHCSATCQHVQTKLWSAIQREKWLGQPFIGTDCPIIKTQPVSDAPEGELPGFMAAV